ncbi:PTS sugar transporter subunit IIB [Lactiplantibacillus daowaiensis]|uniref:PTS sugar transporter subunit IIB n=1 Tax=Lactiplantibacillus daowaiensis TaxID=2559918 RepID=A0ABW1S1S4_9LACO|nr:PTS sugar transporter subunit IIB [Lactiplantibacillus daowaiensis]
MSEIVLARIDDRLIHGQVMTAWLQYTGGNHIVIIDDETAKDDFLKTVMEMSVPEGVALDVFSINDAIEFLKNDANDDKLLLLAKTPGAYYALIEGGVKLANLVVGGMGAAKGRTKFYKNISASDDERETFKNIIEAGTVVNVQIVPSDKATNVAGLLN